MKNYALLVLSFLAGAAVATVVLQTRHKSAEAVARVTGKQREELSTTREKASAAELKKVEEKSAVLAAESATLRQKLQRLEVTATATPAPMPSAAPAESGQKNGLGNFLGKMLENPETRKAMAAQQAMALRQFYSDFVKNARLTPAETEKFYDLLAQRQMSSMEAASALFKDGQDPRDPALMKRVEEATGAMNEELAKSLGPERAGQFHDYEKTLADRMSLTQLNQQLTASGTALNENQTAGLLQIMSAQRAQEREASIVQPGNLRSLNMTDEQTSAYFQRQEDLNTRVRANATSLLTPPQMQALEAAQKQQIEMQKMGIKMARQMFGGK